MRTEFVVYVGPSLPSAKARVRPNVNVLNPVVCGQLRDLAKAATGSLKVLIIDGVFGAGQAVTLAEIRGFIQEGHSLYGATSMGALRASEAGPVGMRGLGSIFQEYAEGKRVRDSDVALLHDDQGRPLTVPFINVELLVELMRLRGLSTEEAHAVLKVCDGVHYSERSADVVAEACRISAKREGVPVHDLFIGDGLLQWDRKQQDAKLSLSKFLSYADDSLCSTKPTPSHFNDLLSPRAGVALNASLT